MSFTRRELAKNTEHVGVVKIEKLQNSFDDCFLREAFI